MLYQEVSWWSYRCIRPVGSSPSLTDHNVGCQHQTGLGGSTASAARSGSGSSGPMVGGIIGAIVVIGAGALIFARRRRTATADDRE
jgi:LPXTG-motif cell wall-anchored protein